MRYRPFRPALVFCYLLLFSHHVFTQDAGEQHFKIDYTFAPQSAEGWSNNLVQTTNGLQLQQPDLTGRFISKTIEIPLTGERPFWALSLTWQMQEQDRDELLFQVKGSVDGSNWEVWETIKKDEHAPVDLQKSFSQLLLLDGRFHFVKIKIDFPIQSRSQLQQLSLRFFNPGISQEQSVGESLFNEADGCICPAPPILKRDDWCPTGDCPTNPSPDSTAVTHLIVHHSATSNASSDWAAVVRSIWDTHVNAWGWSDIGYNWLIDPNGQLYEGRGQAIQGAHFCGTNTGTSGVCMLGNYQAIPPSNATQQTLQKFLAWQSCFEDIDPVGSSLHLASDLNLFHISGHRDGCSTECPGDAFYPLLTGIRQGVQSFISNSCETVSDDSPTISTDLEVRIFPNPNTGLFYLQHNSESIGEATLFTAQGQKIWRKGIPILPQQTLNVSTIAPGIYWLHLKFAETILYRKIVIQ